MESVSFKIYLENAAADGGSGSEIRRFCIDESSAGTFECVKEKIRHLYPALQNREFNIFWKDNENDKIAVNSDIEYIVAITTIREEVRDDIVRLYVTLANDVHHASTDTSANEEKAANVIRYTPEELKALNSVTGDVNQDDDDESSGGDEGGDASGGNSKVSASGVCETKTAVTFAPGSLKGLVCGSCQKSLDGRLMFKCVTCPDYDLCAYCVKQSHLEHVMIRIPSQQALMRSGIFVVDRLNKLARRHSHTSRFDFSALIVPLADNYKVAHFRKMKDAHDTLMSYNRSFSASAANCAAAASSSCAAAAPLPVVSSGAAGGGGGCYTTFYTTSRKAAKRVAAAAAKGGIAFPVSTSHPRPYIIRSYGVGAGGDDRMFRGGSEEERKSKEKEEKKERKEKEKEEKRERKEQGKESGLKRSRSARGESERLRGEWLGAGISANTILDHLVHPGFLGSPANDVIRGVADILANVNISCPYEQKREEKKQPAPATASSSQPETKQPEETKKRKVSASNAAAVTPQPQTVGLLLKDLLGDFKADLNGAAAAAQSKGDKKTNTDTQQNTDDNTSPAQQQQGKDKTPPPTSPPQNLLDDNDGIRVTAVLEDVEVEGGSSPDEQGWTFVDPALTLGAIPKQTASVYPSPSDIPQATDVQVQPPAAVPPTAQQQAGNVKVAPTEKQERLHAALNKMQAMGFTNEGGWLEKLLDNHDASIERVLEILLPSSVFGRVID